MKMKPIQYGKQYVSDEDIEAVVGVLRSDYLTQGPAVREFEDRFSAYSGSTYAIAVCNGTAALHLSVMALGLKSGDRVITSPLTFVASANCIRYCGAEVDFVDIDPDTYLMDLDKLEEKLSSVPVGTYKGVIPVDFAGYPVDGERLKSICQKYKLWIVQDCCHSPGAEFVDTLGNVQRSGNCAYADVQVFSFHPVKHIATGEGGMVTTNRKDLFETISLLRTHGITRDSGKLLENHGDWYYEMQELGYNYRISDILAALGVSQLKRADNGIKRRQDIASKYDAAFASHLEIRTPKVKYRVSHAYHLYIIQVDNRKGLYDYLRSKSIYAQVLYIPVHMQPYYRNLGWSEGDFPVVENYYKHCLALPMFPSLTNEQFDYVVKCVLSFFYL